MKKVLFLIHDLGQGGAEKVLVNLLNNIDKERFDVTLMTLFDTGINKQFLNNSIKYRTVFHRTFRGNTHLFKLFSPEFLHRILIREKYDIEVSYLEGPCARIISGCKSVGTKKVSWIHIEQKSIKGVSRSFRNKCEAEKCYNTFDEIVCVSKAVKQSFNSVLNIDVPMSVLYNTNESEEIRKLSREYITECRIPNDKITLVGVGKLLKSKGFDRILRVFKRLVDEGYPIHLLILGIGPEKNSLLEYIRVSELDDKVDLLGYQINPYKFVSASDLFVCASYAEGFSTAATEALIVGTPVCTTEVSGMKEMLGENNEYGVVVVNDENALYQGIKSLLDTPGLLTYYRKQAEVRGKMFSTENTVRAVEEMLTSLVKE